jgi:pyruvate dehydrogenase E1 component beta subunit
VFDDASRSCGFAAEIVATAAEEMALDASPRRVTRADVPISYAVELELAALPSRERLAEAVRKVVTEAVRR